MTPSLRKKQEFIDCHVTTLRFAIGALKPIRQLYASIQSGCFARGMQMGRKEHEVYSGFAGVRMRWYFANSPKAIGLFRSVLDDCKLKAARTIVSDNPDRVRVVQASIIEVRGSYPTGRWHSDFADEDL